MSERELVAKIATNLSRDHSEATLLVIRAILCEAGHAELVAALTRARMCIVFLSALGSKDPVLAEIDAALRKAGEQ